MAPPQTHSKLLSSPEASLTLRAGDWPLGSRVGLQMQTRATQPQKLCLQRWQEKPRSGVAAAWTWQCSAKKGRVGSNGHIPGRPGAAGPGPGSVGHEATGLPSRESACDSGPSDGPDLELGCLIGPRRYLATSWGSFSRVWDDSWEGPERSWGWAEPMAGGPCGFVPASVLPLPGDCGAGDEVSFQLLLGMLLEILLRL
uniref:Uncharacterized protein n=1 Tax=Myotis myotis TaxID=51298 RepID=A0A7J7Z504_MYOMY|nr:hypothetical protein mMyoMyo1_010694 [Myotis myotis]